MIRKIVLIVPFAFLFLETLGQGWLTEENKFETNWNITFQVGSNLLLGEIKNNFSEFNTNMSNYPGVGVNVQLSKMAWERIDIGIETGFMTFQGANTNPSGINYLSLSGKFNHDTLLFLPYPVVYSTSVFNTGINVKYNFINFSTYELSYLKLNMYARLAVGFVALVSSMGYKEESNYQLSGLGDPLFSTNEIPFLNRIKIYISTSLGTNYQLSERIFLSAEMGFHFLNSDLIDGTYNMNNQLTPEIRAELYDEYRIPITSITGKFMLGCTYFFNFNTKKKIWNEVYPWYNNRYRSYFSKYHNPASKKKIKERLPFYKNNFDE